MRIKELPIELRPREKALTLGVDKLSDHELLMLVLRHGNSQMSVSQIAHNVLIKSSNLKKLGEMTLEELMSIDGIKLAKALEVKAILELSKRVGRAEVHNLNVMENSSSVIEWLQTEIGHENQECFLVIYLSVANKVINYEIIFKGTLDRSLVHPREIFNRAIKYSANSIIAVHNHPGGTLVPSEMDIVVTNALVDAGKLLGISVIDHLIITREGFYSILHQITRSST
jgi:DNA repair protein RadC